MKQSKFMSLFETFGGTIVGFFVSLGIQHGVCWWYELPLAASQNVVIIGIFTVASLIRGYGWRRFCEAIHVRHPLTPFMHAALEECFRQRDQEGYSIDHDDMLPTRDLAAAGAAFLLHAGTASRTPPHEWPWSGELWKPNGYRRDLVRGVALGIAEGDKFDRASKRRVAA